MTYRKTKEAMKSERQKQENNICLMAGGIIGRVLSELFISEILHAGFVSKPVQSVFMTCAAPLRKKTGS